MDLIGLVKTKKKTKKKPASIIDQERKKHHQQQESLERKIESRHDQDLAQPYCASSENEKAASIFTLMKLVTL